MAEHNDRSAESAAALTERLIQAAVDYELGRIGGPAFTAARTAVERAIGAPAQPVAWRCRSFVEPDWDYDVEPLAADDLARQDEGFEEQPLYAAQPPAAPVEDDELIGLNARLSDALAEIRLLKTEILHRGSSAGNADAVTLLQARYVLRDLHHKHPDCGYGKMADACEAAALNEPQAPQDHAGAHRLAELITDYADNNLSMFDACDMPSDKAKELYEQAKALRDRLASSLSRPHLSCGEDK